MPSLTDALRFAASPATSAEQLRRACRLLFLTDDGTAEAVRERLTDHLQRLNAENPVVCLNPKLTEPDSPTQ